MNINKRRDGRQREVFMKRLFIMMREVSILLYQCQKVIDCKIKASFGRCLYGHITLPEVLFLFCLCFSFLFEVKSFGIEAVAVLGVERARDDALGEDGLHLE